MSAQITIIFKSYKTLLQGLTYLNINKFIKTYSRYFMLFIKTEEELRQENENFCS